MDMDLDIHAHIFGLYPHMISIRVDGMHIKDKVKLK